MIDSVSEDFLFVTKYMTEDATAFENLRIFSFPIYR